MCYIAHKLSGRKHRWKIVIVYLLLLVAGKVILSLTKSSRFSHRGQECHLDAFDLAVKLDSPFDNSRAWSFTPRRFFKNARGLPHFLYQILDPHHLPVLCIVECLLYEEWNRGVLNPSISCHLLARFRPVINLLSDATIKFVWLSGV
ncbi:hypothetical protein NPIL_482961 [Nephila pilipes]|uniref:Uncharacterized protein n=1 Tax=Nephila pilipes TaxID=299642 RepID=A0A8X6Q8X5_NEPPI|nr:hypothetical protein NPIL_482961 [Nephila pilipes]